MSPLTFTVRVPEDLLALVPVVLGFHPEDSVVMLVFESGRRIHIRLTLPVSGARAPDLEAWVAVLLEAVQRHRVTQVALVFLSADAARVAQVAALLGHRLKEAGVEVVDAIYADGREWFPALSAHEADRQGTAYDVSDHPIRAQSVVLGIVIHPSREAMVAASEAAAAQAAASMRRSND